MNTHDKIELPAFTVQFDGQDFYSADAVRSAIEADRQRRGEPVAWPKNPQEIRDFIDVHFISMTGDDAPREDDKYLVTAHDLLSAFSWWTDFSPQRNRIDESMKAGARLTKHRLRLDAPQPAEPVKVEPIGVFIKADHGDYPVLQWTPGYKAVVGDKLYLAPQPATPVVKESLAVAETAHEVSDPARLRVQLFLDRWAGMRGNDQSVIHAIDGDDYELRVDDLRTLLSRHGQK